jgi:hypothetical protein
MIGSRARCPADDPDEPRRSLTSTATSIARLKVWQARWNRRRYGLVGEGLISLLVIGGDTGAQFSVNTPNLCAKSKCWTKCRVRDFDTTESLTTLPKGMRPEGVG